MGFFDKFLDAVRLNDDYDDDDEFFDDDDDDYDDEPEEEAAPKKKHFGSRKSVNTTRETEEAEPSARPSLRPPEDIPQRPACRQDLQHSLRR